MDRVLAFNMEGKEAPAADGGDYGIRIVGYNFGSEEFVVQSIVWSTGEVFKNYLDEVHYISTFKASYRYVLGNSRDINNV